METKIRGRALFILAVVLACILGVTGFPRNVKELKENLHSRIHLGLDLKGGTNLILQVQVEDAVNITSDEALERLKDELKAKNIPYAIFKKTTTKARLPPFIESLLKEFPRTEHPTCKPWRPVSIRTGIWSASLVKRPRGCWC